MNQQENQHRAAGEASASDYLGGDGGGDAAMHALDAGGHGARAGGGHVPVRGAGNGAKHDDSVATTADFREFRREIREDFKEFRKEIREDFKEFRSEIKEENKETRAEAKADNKETRAAVAAARAEAREDNRETRVFIIKWTLAMFAAFSALVVAAIKLL